MTVPTSGAADPEVVVLAGGKGRRLAPLTDHVPKPLLAVGGRAVLDHILSGLAAEGLCRVVLSVGHLGALIEKHVVESRLEQDLGLHIEIVRESTPLGTAGALSLLGVDGPVLVVNGDILTDLRFRDVVSTHHASGAAMTIAMQRREFPVPLGVVEIDEDLRVRSLTEKPTVLLDCAVGVNVYGPAAVAIASQGGAVDFPDVVQVLLATGHSVGAHRFDGAWFDIGDVAGYQAANESIHHLHAAHVGRLAP